MTNARKTTLLLTLLVIAATTLRAQEGRRKESTQGKTQGPPRHSVRIDETASHLPKIELPEFIITGALRLNAPEVEKMSALSSAMVPIPSVPFLGLGEKGNLSPDERLMGVPPAPEVKREPSRGRTSVLYGRFGSPSILAIAGDRAGELRSSVKGFIDGSDGFDPATEYLRGGLHADITMPLRSSEGLLDRALFGAEASAQGWRYRLYGSTTPELLRIQRSGGIRLSLRSAEAAPFRYTVTGGWKTTSQSDSSSLHENVIDIALHLSQATAGIRLGGDFSYWVNPVVSRSLSSDRTTVSLLQVGGSAEMAGPMEIHGGAGVQIAQPNREGTLVVPRFQVSLSYGLTPEVTGFFLVKSGYETRTLAGLFEINPYLMNSADVHLRRVKYEVRSGLMFPVWGLIHGTVSIGTGEEDEFVEFADLDSDGVWELNYAGGVTVKKLQAEAAGNLTALDEIAASIHYTSVRDPATTNVVPYVPALQALMKWTHLLDEEISAEVHVEYRSSVPTDWLNRGFIAGWFVVGASAEYKVSSQTRLHARIENLFDTRYYRWNGYRERPLFLTLGFDWRW